MPAPLLTLQNIRLTIGRTLLLDDAELFVEPGMRQCIVGRNGSGKSTLMKIAAGMSEPDGGQRFIQPGASIRYLPQEPDLSGYADTFAYVADGLQPGEDTNRAYYLLGHLGLTGAEDPAHLSGGEKRRAALALLTLLTIALPFVVRYPLSADYLNHMTRIFILSAPENAPIHQYFVPHWRLLTNLGLEIFALPLAKLLPLELVMKLVWIFCVAGMAHATWLLQRALHGRTNPAILLAAPLLINLPLTMGFFGFTLGTVVALYAFGFWVRRPPVLWRRLVFNVAAALAVLCHIAAGATLGFTLVIWEAFRPRPLRFSSISLGAGRAVSGLLLAGGVMLAAKLTGPASPPYLPAIFYFFNQKSWLFSTPTVSGTPAADNVGLMVFCLGFLLILICGRRPKGLGILLSAWVILLLALPQGIANASYIDARLSLFPALLLIAGSDIPIGPETSVMARRGGQILATLAIIATLVRLGLMLPDWLAHDRVAAETRALGRQLPQGAKVLVSGNDLKAQKGEWAPGVEHLPTLWCIDKGAFVSTVFDDPKMQPIAPTGTVRNFARPNVGLIPWSTLMQGEAAEHDPRFARGHDARYWYRFWTVYPRHWQDRYDYIAMRSLKGEAPLPTRTDLKLIGQSGAFRLYRIVKPLH